MQNFEFKPVGVGQLAVAILMDGKWYTHKMLREKVVPQSRSMRETLNRLSRQGYVIVADNPRATGKVFHRDGGLNGLIYKGTGKQWRNTLYESEFKRVRIWAIFRPRRWHDICYSAEAQEICS